MLTDIISVVKPSFSIKSYRIAQALFHFPAGTIIQIFYFGWAG
jgi:hypothetical protein